jgi:4-diphosphocytidyl-2-C-methyl-D-erythritol kinase
MRSIILKSPAKINLFLRVINKRKDGFHNIETIFERINLFDTIKLKENSLDKIRVFCNHPDVPLGSSNLCFKAADIIRKSCSIKQGVDIYLKKRIPVAAGLGGGSGNAAFVMLGLNKLWHLGLKKNQLSRFAAKLGSDVAFFVSEERFAFGAGRGEKISGLKGIKPLWHILVAPALKTPTSRVYGSLNLRLTKKKVNVNILIHALRQNSAILLSRLLMNDLEKAAAKVQPGLIKIKNRLQTLGIDYPVLSGSGSALFGLAKSQKEAKALESRLKGKVRAELFVVKTY